MPDYSVLANPSAVGAQVSQNFLAGMEYARQAKTRQAFVNYLRDPSEQNVNGVAVNDPELGMQLMDREAQRKQMLLAKTQQLQAQQVRERAAAGDPQATAQLAGIDFDAWTKLDAHQKAAVKDSNDYIGQAALQISQLPEAQRPAAWDAAIDQGTQMGFDQLAQYKGRYSPDALNAVLAHAGQMKQFLDLTRPQYMTVPEGGMLVNTRDPAALQQTQQGIPPEAIDALKKGEGTPEQFDALFGSGAAAKVMGGASGNAGGGFPNIASYYGQH